MTGLREDLRPDGETGVNDAILDVRHLRTEYFSDEGPVGAVDDVSFSVSAGETLCIVGESGCGKSATLRSILNLISPRSGRVLDGQVLFDGTDLLQADQRTLRHIRGNDMTLISQDPMASLNPLQRIGDQMCAVIEAHNSVKRSEARDRSVELLERVGVPEPRARLRQYPHEFSGGMLQRVMIAMAIANRPRLLLADEPTTALDVTVQAQILDLLESMQTEIGTAVVLVTHDLGVVAEIADRVLVMYAGKVVETGSAAELLANPTHPYTSALLASLPGEGPRGARLRAIEGQPPNLVARPNGCAFRPRCELTAGRTVCETSEPELLSIGSAGSRSACHFSAELSYDTTPATRKAGDR